MSLMKRSYYILRSFKCITVGETTSGETTWNIICTVAVAKDGDTSISMSHEFREPSEYTLIIREFNFKSAGVSES